MKTNIVMFGGIGVFLLVVAAIYGLVTEFNEMAGFPLLLLTAGLAFMLWFYLRLVNKNHAVMDGDNAEGEISDMAGNYGEFAPWSWWPIGLGATLALLVFGLAIDWWIVLYAIIPALFFITGWVMEYSRKRYRH